jgi:hypothetical protein
VARYQTIRRLRLRHARRTIRLSALCATALALAWAAAPVQAATQTFTFTGAEQTFTVPGGVTSVHVVAIGAGGGAATDSVGGVAAEVAGDVTVTPGQTLYVEVGGQGGSLAEGGGGGFNGGASGGGGGGGSSDVRTSPLVSGLAPDHRLIVAAGGGGGGGSGPNGPGADGGAAGSPGEASELYGGGGAGTATEGGSGAVGCFGGQGGNGELGSGGAGQDAEAVSDPGGGGGGGYFGGGGGAGSCEFGSSGGGGGSSLVPPLGSIALALAATEPQVRITYTPAVAIVSPAPNPPAPIPNTVLGSHPKKPIKTKKQKVRVNLGFSSDIAGATFQCKLDKGAFAPCVSPKSYKVKIGRHTFSVAAVSGGVVDPTPASVSFKVVKVKKKH